MPGASPFVPPPSLSIQRRTAIAALCAAYAVLSVLVAAGACTGLDQAAVDHAMPGLSLRRSTLLDIFVPGAGDHGWHLVADLWLYPASAPVSGALVAACALVLRRRGRGRQGALWIAAWFGGTLAELVVKHALERPALYDAGRVIDGFGNSLPSGHALRSFVLAALLTSLWPRGRLAWPWATTVWVLLVVEGWHTPTDVAAGILLGAALVLAVRESRVEAQATG